jgi:glycosyltransferase involved in cell wall biosynthesis
MIDDELPLVSIVGAYYNRADHVDRAIESLLSQTYPNVEMLIIDDGSNDATLERLCSFDDPRLRVVSQENAGFVRSIRRAISGTTGALIAVHGSGELADPRLIERLVPVFDDRAVVWAGPRQMQLDFATGVSELPPLPSVERFLRRGKDGSGIAHGGSMMRRSAYEQVGGYRTFFTFAQDFDLQQRLGEIGKLVVVNEVLYTRVQIQGGVSTDLRSRAWRIALREFAWHCANERRSGRPDPLDQAGPTSFLVAPHSHRAGRAYVVLARDAHRATEFEFARHCLQLAAREKLKVEARLLGLLIRASLRCPRLGAISNRFAAAVVRRDVL